MSGNLALPVILVTGPSGAGRTTAIKAFEDIGFEVIDNLPVSMMARLFDGTPLDRPVALGVDVRNRDFSISELMSALASLRRYPEYDPQFLFLECDEDVLIRRFSETRRRHPLTSTDTVLEGIHREQHLLGDLGEFADELIDTSGFSPHELRAEIIQRFGHERDPGLSISVQSFSYKRGLPRGADFVFDCRFLNNPHWDAELRPHTGQDADVRAFVEADPRALPYFEKIVGMADLVIPASREEGKANLMFAFGCTGGKHRSVAFAEKLAELLQEQGIAVSLRHRELERLGLLATGKADAKEAMC